MWFRMSNLTCGNVMTCLCQSFHISLNYNLIDISYLKNGLRYSNSKPTIGLGIPKNIHFDSSITSLALFNQELRNNAFFRHFEYWRPFCFLGSHLVYFNRCYLISESCCRKQKSNRSSCCQDIEAERMLDSGQTAYYLNSELLFD